MGYIQDLYESRDRCLDVAERRATSLSNLIRTKKSLDPDMQVYLMEVLNSLDAMIYHLKHVDMPKEMRDEGI